MTKSTTSHILQRVCPCIIDADLAKFMEEDEVGEIEYRSCLGTPSLIPIISVREEAGTWREFPLTQAYCRACAKVANIDDIVSPNLWRVVELYFENKGIGRADRKATTMKWITSVKFVESMKAEKKGVLVVEVMETGHGHVRPRKDGERARCGGPAICADCAVEANQKRIEDLEAAKADEKAQLDKRIIKLQEEQVARIDSQLADRLEEDLKAETLNEGEGEASNLQPEEASDGKEEKNVEQ